MESLSSDRSSNQDSIIDEHMVSAEELQNRLQTDSECGLSHAEAESRFKKYGPNALTPPKKTPEWIKFCRTMFTGFSLLLWVAGVLCFVAYGIEVSQKSSSDYQVSAAVPHQIRCNHCDVNLNSRAGT